jgi:uncharacterized membrane protein
VTGFGLVAIAFVLALLATTIVFGAGILGVPIAVVAIAAIALFDFRRRRTQAEDVREFRNQAQTEKVDFTERDKETLASE